MGDRKGAGFAADAPGDGLAEGLEKLGDPGGSRGLAVGTADGNAISGVDELCQYFAAKTRIDASLTFRIVSGDCRSDNHFVRILQMIGRMPDKNGNALRLQPARTRRRLQVAAGHFMPPRLQKDGEASHADPANANEMNPHRLHLALNSSTDILSFFTIESSFLE